MGEFKFRLPADWSLERRHASIIHTVGLDGVPWPCKISVDDQILTVSRIRDESGKTFVPWTFDGFGELLISTGTLVESDHPYCLLIELTRGTLSRLRNQISIWQEGGLDIPAATQDCCAASASHLGDAIMQRDPLRQHELAARALQAAGEAIFKLAESFGQQVTQFRIKTPDINALWIANTASPNQPASEGMEAEGFELVRMSFSQLESIKDESHSKRVIVGPFLDASANGMSQTLTDVSDYQQRRGLILDSCRESLADLSSSVSLLHVAGGLNGMGHRHLSYPQQLELTTQLLEEVSNTNLEVPTMVSFDFPWAERLASAVGGSHPLQIADSLLRQGAQISFLGIEVNLNYFPGGSAIRDPLQWIDMLDVWTQLGLPLVVLLRAPTWTLPLAEAQNSDQRANPDSVPADPAPARHVNSFDHSCDHRRLSYLKTILPMLVARPAVHGVIWSQWRDGDDDRFPYGGLVDKNDQLKSVQQLLTNVQR